MSILKSKKCQICKIRRQQRFCLRKGKDVCWECCNNMRYDRQCPQECRYSVKQGEGFEISKTNADSLTEYRGLIERMMDLWLRMPSPELNDFIPEEMVKTKEGREELLDYFKKTRLTSFLNINYLRNKLNLNELTATETRESNEDVGNRYLRLIVAGDFISSLDCHKYGEMIRKDAELLNDYLSDLKDDKLIKKITEFRLISSALSEDRKSGLVFYDINGKYDLCLKLENEDDNWKVLSRFYGKMEIVNGENEAMRHIAVLISKNDLTQAEELLKKYLSIYPDSSDLYYYQGVMQAIKGNNAQAKKAFLRSMRLDPEFTESIYNYALQLHLEGKIEKAMELYKRVIEINAEDIKTLNNLAAIYIDKGDFIEAEKYISCCRSIEPEFEPLLANIKRLEEKKVEKT